jgi:hypothetical protein
MQLDDLNSSVNDRYSKHDNALFIDSTDFNDVFIYRKHTNIYHFKHLQQCIMHLNLNRSTVMLRGAGCPHREILYKWYILHTTHG